MQGHPTVLLKRSSPVKEAGNILGLKEKEELHRHFPQGIVALDVETTGLSPLTDFIVECAAVKILPDSSLHIFNCTVNPGHPIPRSSTAIHGITDAFVQKAQGPEVVLPKFIDFAGGLPLVAHNAVFDFGHLISGLHRLGLPPPPLSIYCSLRAARTAFEDMPDNKLSTLAHKLKIPLISHHRALDDALCSLAIFARALMEKKEKISEKAYLFNGKDIQGEEPFSMPPSIVPLAERVAGGKDIEIVYSKGKRKGQFRPVRPVGILPLPEGSALYALCLLDNKHKNFLLRKIVDFRDGEKLIPVVGSSKENIFYYGQKALIILAHLGLLFWIGFVLMESGAMSLGPVLGHFAGLSLYGGGLIWFTAKWDRHNHLEKIRKKRKTHGG